MDKSHAQAAETRRKNEQARRERRERERAEQAAQVSALRWWRSGLPSLVRPATTADPHRDPHGETKQRR